MTKLEITEKDRRNELIDRFAGHTFQMSSISDHKVLSIRLVKTLRYHTDWNQLIRACESFHNIKLRGMSKENKNQWQIHELNISESVSCYDIHQAHKELASGIEWYNSIKKNKK